MLAMAVFSDRMVPERTQTFWDALQRGEFITDAAAAVGTPHWVWWVKIQLLIWCGFADDGSR